MTLRCHPLGYAEEPGSSRYEHNGHTAAKPNGWCEWTRIHDHRSVSLCREKRGLGTGNKKSGQATFSCVMTPVVTATERPSWFNQPLVRHELPTQRTCVNSQQPFGDSRLASEDRRPAGPRLHVTPTRTTTRISRKVVCPTFLPEYCGIELSFAQAGREDSLECEAAGRPR